MAAVIPPVEKKTSTIFSHASDVGVKCKATRGAWPMTPFRVVVRLVIFADEWRCSGTRGQAFRPDTGTSAIPRGRAAHRAVRDLTIPCGGKAFAEPAAGHQIEILCLTPLVKLTCQLACDVASSRS